MNWRHLICGSLTTFVWAADAKPSWSQEETRAIVIPYMSPQQPARCPNCLGAQTWLYLAYEDQGKDRSFFHFPALPAAGQSTETTSGHVAALNQE